MTTRPKRFYRTVTVDGAAPAFRVLLDGRPIRTPAKRELAVPSKALAEAVAAEWEAQGERIDPASMPLTRLVNSAIDGVTGREAEVRADIAKYGASDLLCYRAEGPAELVRRQAEAWDPVLAWAREAGYRRCLVDFTAANRVSARFWLGHGFRPIAYRLCHRLDERLAFGQTGRPLGMR